MRVTAMIKSFKSVVAGLAIVLTSTSTFAAEGNSSDARELLEQQMAELEKEAENFDPEEYVREIENMSDEEYSEYVQSGIFDIQKFRELKKNNIDLDLNDLDNFENFDFDLSEPQEPTIKPILI